MMKVNPLFSQFSANPPKESAIPKQDIDEPLFRQMSAPLPSEQGAPGTVRTSEPMPIAKPDVTFRNWTLAIIFLVIAVCGDVYSISAAQTQTLSKVAVAVLAFGALYQAIREIIGIRLTRDQISFPYRPIRGIPTLAFWQSSRNLQDITELGILRRWWWMEQVALNEEVPRIVLLFSTTKRRRAFMNDMKARIPHLRFQKYR